MCHFLFIFKEERPKNASGPKNLTNQWLVLYLDFSPWGSIQLHWKLYIITLVTTVIANVSSSRILLMKFQNNKHQIYRFSLLGIFYFYQIYPLRKVNYIDCIIVLRLIRCDIIVLRIGTPNVLSVKKKLNKSKEKNLKRVTIFQIDPS